MEVFLNLGAAGRSLAIPETQVLIEMDDDKYMQHILLVKLEPGVWITVDTQGVVERSDLRELEVSPLLRDADFPSEGRPYTVCSRDRRDVDRVAEPCTTARGGPGVRCGRSRSR